MTNRQSLDRPRNVACSCPNKFEVPLCVLLCEDRGILNLVDEEQDVFLLTRSKVEHDVRCDPKHVDRGCRACACCADDGHMDGILPPAGRGCVLIRFRCLYRRSATTTNKALAMPFRALQAQRAASTHQNISSLKALKVILISPSD